MKIRDWVKRKEERSFRWWLDSEKKKGGEYEEGAILAEYAIPRLFIEAYPHINIKEIYDMSWKDVVIRVELAASKIGNVNDKVNSVSSQYSNSIKNTG